MKIELQNAGKRFNREWIFRRLDYQFTSGNKYALAGPNGSGKSTLLQVLGGAVMHSEGKIFWSEDGHDCSENVFRHISVAAPYLDLIDEMTPIELLDFHRTFKPLKFPAQQILEMAGLEKAHNKQIRYFSSGMKQRLKLAQAIFSKTTILLLDEPTTNLDDSGIAVYKKWIDDYTAERLVIVASNDPREYEFCTSVLQVSEFK